MKMRLQYEHHCRKQEKTVSWYESEKVGANGMYLSYSRHCAHCGAEPIVISRVMVSA